MRNFEKIFFLWTFFPLWMFAQTYKLNPVEITAERPSKIKLKHSSFEILTDSLNLFPFAGGSTDKALNLAPATYIRDYGGLGALKTVSVRGFASNQSRVSLLGIPYRNIFSSVVNLANFSADWAGKIQIKYFNPSDFQPAAPVVIDLTPNLTSFSYVSAEIKSFNTQNFTLRFFKEVADWKFLSHSSYAHSDNTFFYSLNEEEGVRTPAPYKNLFQSLVFRKKSFKNTWTYLGFGTKNSLAVPPPIVKNNTQGIQEKVKGNSSFSLFHWEHKKNIFFSNVFALKHHYSDLLYSNSYNLSNTYFSRTYGVYEKVQFLYGAFVFSGIYSLDYSFVNGNNLGIGFNRIPSAHRTEQMLSVSSVWEKNEHSASFRLDFRDISGFRPVGQGGIKYSFLTPKWQFSVYALRNYRFPAINELYFIGFGNPDLLPEKVEQIVLSASRTFHNFYFFLSPFVNRTRNKIIAVPVHPARWSVISLGFTNTYGVETGVEIRFFKNWKYYGSFTWQNAADRSLTDGNILPYTPEILNKNLLTWENKHFVFSLQGDFIGRRYVNLGNSDFLKAYFLINALASYRFAQKKWIFYWELTLENLSDTRYEIIRSYPMPSRSFGIRLRIYYR